MCKIIVKSAADYLHPFYFVSTAIYRIIKLKGQPILKGKKMKTVNVHTMILGLILGSLLAAGAASAHEAKAPMHDTAYELSGPFTHQNLSIYFVHSKEKSTSGQEYITLQEALEKGAVKIVETGSVGNLTIINNAKNANIFIQSGDIVKGGRQDRTIKYDYIITPRHKELSLSSFCVEHGRWSKRGGEAGDKFSSSSDRLSSRELQMAAKYEGNQSRVWEEVGNAQTKLSRNIGKPVKSPESESSLQLTLENKDLNEFVDEYIEALAPAIKTKKYVVGIVAAINGRVVTADIYESENLFAKLSDKLLRAAAVEAAAEYQKGKDFGIPSVCQAQEFLSDENACKERYEQVNSDTILRITETKDKVIFDTYFQKTNSMPVHRNFIYSNEEERSSSRRHNLDQIQTEPARR